MSIGAEELAEFGEQIHKSSQASKKHVGIWVWPLERERALGYDVPIIGKESSAIFDFLFVSSTQVCKFLGNTFKNSRLKSEEGEGERSGGAKKMRDYSRTSLPINLHFSVCNLSLALSLSLALCNFSRTS